MHLLRGFTQWTDRRDGAPIRTVDEARSWVEYIARVMRPTQTFYTWTSRRPVRAPELEGGSVYFVQARETLFRMPFAAIEEEDGGWAICMRPRLIEVERRHVGFLRGWRYLPAANAPPDMPAADPEAAPADLRAAGLA